MTLKGADGLTPQIHLSKIINSLAPSDFKTSRVIVMAPQYMDELAIILNRMSKEVLQTYFLWKAVQAFSSDIEADAIKPYRRFTNELQGKVSCHLQMRLFLFLPYTGPRLDPRALADMCQPCRRRPRLDPEPIFRRESFLCQS